MLTRSGFPLLWLLAASPALPADKPVLKIARIDLHQFEDGPSLPPNHSFIGGETVFLTFRISGFQKPENGKIDLVYEVRAVDPAGVPLVPPNKAAIQSQVFEEDKDWLPKGRHEFVLPPWSEPGTSKVLVHVEDKLAKTQADAELTFRIRGRTVEPSDALVVRNFQFLRDENDRQGLKPAAYRPGDTLWMRFDMTGFKTGAKNELDVSYGLAVLRPDGSTFFEQPDAAREQGGPEFYRRRFLPAILNLTTTKEVAKGQYTFVLKVEDKIGGQKTEIREPFSIE
jgi:hypothetical protein